MLTLAPILAAVLLAGPQFETPAPVVTLPADDVGAATGNAVGDIDGDGIRRTEWGRQILIAELRRR